MAADAELGVARGVPPAVGMHDGELARRHGYGDDEVAQVEAVDAFVLKRGDGVILAFGYVEVFLGVEGSLAFGHRTREPARRLGIVGGPLVAAEHFMEDRDLGLRVDVVLLEDLDNLVGGFLRERDVGAGGLEERAHHQADHQHRCGLGRGLVFVLHLGEHAVEVPAGLVGDGRMLGLDLVEDFVGHDVEVVGERLLEDRAQTLLEDVTVGEGRIGRQAIEDEAEFAALGRKM